MDKQEAEHKGEMRCKNCKHALRRSDFSFQRYGNYSHNQECCLPENELTPYRRNNDTCDKWEAKNDGCKVD